MTENIDRRLRKAETRKTDAGTESQRDAATGAAKHPVEGDQPLRITSTVIDIDHQETFYAVEYCDLEGNKKTADVPRQLFQRPAKVVELLLTIGADLRAGRKETESAVRRVLDSIPNTIRHVTARAGWYQQTTIVYPGQSFGELADKTQYKPNRELDPSFGLKAGTLEAWQAGLKRPCRWSDYLILILGHKAANLLLEPLGEDEGCILHLHGANAKTAEKAASSSGKTLATRAAESMTGRAQQNDLPTFAISETALCELCHARNHMGAGLDEEGRSLGNSRVATSADQAAYMVASGRGVARSSMATRHRELKNLTWLINAITSGEPPLDRNRDRAEGAQVRMVGLPVPPGADGGIFNRVQTIDDARLKKCKRLAKEVEDTIAQNYGVLFPAFAEQLVPIRDTIKERVSPLIDALIAKVGADTDPWERRFARKLAIAGAAAIFLSQLGLCPWTEKRAKNAFLRLYKIARAAVRTEEQLTNLVVAKIRKRLRDDTFPRVQKGDGIRASERKRARRLGFRRQLPEFGEVVAMTSSAVARILGDRAALPGVLRRLADQGITIAGEDGKGTRQLAVKGLSKGRHRYVCFSVGAVLGAKQ